MTHPFTLGANRNDVYLPFIPMDVSYGVAEMFLAEADEGTSDAISIPIGFPFGQSIQTQFYVRVNTFGTLIKKFSEFSSQVGTNGLLSFGTAYNFFQNREFPFSARYLVAPFWDDMDTRGGNGRISYEIHQSGYFLDQVSTYLNRKRPSEFQGTWMAVAYYDAVHPYLGTSNPEVSMV